MNGRRHKIGRESLSAEYPVALRIGSGKIGSSFAVQIGGEWFQSPISWYAQSGRFRVSPGYEQEKHPDFDRRIRAECLYCHASESDRQPVAIGCERCHGNGQAHSAKPIRENIVNPALLEGARRDSVCEQCHLPGVVRVLNPGKRAGDYQPGQVLENTWTTFVAGAEFRVASHVQQLAQSACMSGRAEKLWCGSCHNPHPTKVRPARSVDAVCRDCHQPHDGGVSNCATCHMPRREVSDVIHTAYTDHRIQRTGSTATPVASDLRPWREPSAGFAQRNRALALFESAVTSRDSAAINDAFRQLLDLLGSSANDPPVMSALGAIALQKGRLTEASQWLRKAVELEPGNAEAHFRLGRAEQAAGRLDAALKQYDEAMRLNPLFFEAYAAAAQLHRARMDWESYRGVLNRYLRHVPDSLAARQAVARIPP